MTFKSMLFAPCPCMTNISELTLVKRALGYKQVSLVNSCKRYKHC